VSKLPKPERLPPGRHRLPREQVLRSQRERLLVAMLQSVYDRGYTATTVADVVGLAAVTRSTFYAQFDDREACFIAAYDYAMEHALSHMAAATVDAVPVSWPEHVRRALTAYLDALADEPAIAVTLHMEVLAAGPAAFESRASLLSALAMQVAALNELAAGEDASVRALPGSLFALYTGGLDELIRDRLRTGGAAALRQLAEPLLEATHAMFNA
jgi:AcrR family transcriptional regulator